MRSCDEGVWLRARMEREAAGGMHAGRGLGTPRAACAELRSAAHPQVLRQCVVTGIWGSLLLHGAGVELARGRAHTLLTRRVPLLTAAIARLLRAATRSGPVHDLHEDCSRML